MSPLEARAKRAFDVAASCAGLAVCWPALVGIAAAVRLDSPGPIFYRGERAGKGGHPFRIYKFRTMVIDAERLGGTTTANNDSRITRVGAVLRRHKLDELPQLLNVLVGEMSFVGPRPEVYEYVDAYTGDELHILDVRPGITDLASVEFVNLGEIVGDEDADEHYRRNVLHRKNELRLRYVREQSLSLDAKILGRTIATLTQRVLGGRRG